MPARHQLFACLAALLALAGCTGPEVSERTSGSSTSQPSNTYSSEVDGVSVTWPAEWRLVEKSLDVRPPSNNVQVLVLTTFDGAAAGQCAPDPDAAMARMKESDALFMLRASDGAGDPRPPRPPDLHSAAGLLGRGGCHPEGVEAWRIQFQEHNRPYEVFVAAKSPMSAARRGEIEQIWSALQLTPIDDGRSGAVIGRPYWHSLYTHCGIRATTFNGREWVADPPLFHTPDAGNPPRGWANPDEHGTIKLKDDDTAVFTSRDGERTANFRARTAQDRLTPAVRNAPC